MENLITLNVKSTHFYLIDYGKGKLLVDAGWPELLSRFMSELKSYRVDIHEIKYVLATHNHPDHAGLVQTVKRLSGARQLIPEAQIATLPTLAEFYKNSRDYEPIVVSRDDLVSPDRKTLAAIGIQGEIVPTPGHSADSVSLVLDSGMAFIGDLHLPDMVGEEAEEETRASWQRLAEKKAQVIYPAHGNPFRLHDMDLFSQFSSR